LKKVSYLCKKENDLQQIKNNFNFGFEKQQSFVIRAIIRSSLRQQGEYQQ
jgi:hypothetical protein